MSPLRLEIEYLLNPILCEDMVATVNPFRKVQMSQKLT